jgi:hypothetical protein
MTITEDKMRNCWSKISIATIITLLLTVGAGQAQKLPASTTFGTNPAGHCFLCGQRGPSESDQRRGADESIVQPYTGSSTFMPLLDSGEIDFGIINAVETNLGYQGPAKLQIGGKNPLPHVPNARLIMRGSPLMVSLVVRKDSPIKTVYDVRGKRVTGEYPANIAIWYHVYTELANAGLTWNDVKVVPVPSVNDGIDALVQGRADVSNHAMNAAKIKEADAAVGVRFLSLDCSAQGEARVRNAVPGYYLSTLKSGSATGIIGDTCVLAYDIYWVGHKGLSNEVVTHSLKAVWDNIDKLPPLNPQFQEWTRERAVSADVTVPYHPAAVRFYKDKGVWSAKMDEAQKKLLAVNP